MANESSIYPEIALMNLPPPQIIETPEFETLYEEMWALFLTLSPQYAYRLESDPIVKVIQAWCYRELQIRERINKAALGQLLAFAEGSDLDHLAAASGLERMLVQAANPNANPPIDAVYESDDRLRFRIQLRQKSWATAGAADHYRFWAYSADVRVKDVNVFSPDNQNGYNMGGQVVITILSTEGNNIPTEELMDSVRELVLRDDVKVLTDLVTVEAAVPRQINVTAQIILLPGTPYAVYEASQQRLIDAFNARKRLGMDFTRGFAIDALFDEGVSNVVLTHPSASVVVAPNEYPILGSLNITFGGFSDQESLNVDDVERIRAERFVNERYVKFCIANLRTQAQIKDDLPKVPRDGIVEPTIVGIAKYLGITAIKKADGSYILEDEIAYLIYQNLLPRYATGS